MDLFRSLRMQRLNFLRICVSFYTAYRTIPHCSPGSSSLYCTLFLCTQNLPTFLTLFTMAKPIKGLILAGGESSRMGSNKALLTYHRLPQYLRLKNILQDCGIESFISCKPEHIALFPGTGIIADNPLYSDAGPLNGILSAFEAHPAQPWLVVACDYPLIDVSDILFLMQHRNISRHATVFRNSDKITEPLFGIYEATIEKELMEWYETGNRSLRLFLEQSGALIMDPPKPGHLKSIDTPEKYEAVRHQITE